MRKPLSICVPSEYTLAKAQNTGIAKSNDNVITLCSGYASNSYYQQYNCFEHDPKNVENLYAGTGAYEDRIIRVDIDQQIRVIY